ncbi:MAG: hypothetical protein GY730_04185 [bacterium]|nr:hypothetical protein [bacterium]
MNLDKYRQIVKALVIQAYARVNKNKQDSMAQMKILIDDVVERGIDANKLQTALKKHAETSEFAPTIFHIVKHIEAISPQEERNFLVRFRKQAPSCYEWETEDDDVFTVKHYIGKSYLESGLQSRDWVFVEKQALEIYRQIQNKKLELRQNPKKDKVNTLPGGRARYVDYAEEKSTGRNVKKIKLILPDNLKKLRRGESS